MKKFRTRAIALGASAGVLLVANVAAAAWLSTASSDGTATATSQAAELSTASVGDMYPGRTQDLVFTVTNGNDWPVAVTSLDVASSEIVATPLAEKTCASGTANLDGADRTAATGQRLESTQTDKYVIAPGGSATYTVAVTMVTNPQDGCQGASFEVPVTATLESAAHGVTGQDGVFVTP